MGCVVGSRTGEYTRDMLLCCIVDRALMFSLFRASSILETRRWNSWHDKLSRLFRDYKSEMIRLFFSLWIGVLIATVYGLELIFNAGDWCGLGATANCYSGCWDCRYGSPCQICIRTTEQVDFGGTVRLD